MLNMALASYLKFKLEFRELEPLFYSFHATVLIATSSSS
jgi:hypothetical protein